MKIVTRSKTILSVAALCIVGAVTAQGYDTSAKPWDDLKLNTKKRVKLDFRNANVDLIIRFYAQTSGLTIVKDPTLTGPMSLLTPAQVSLSEALSILSAGLDLKGFQFQREGSFLVIKAKPKQTPGRAGGAAGGFPGGGGGAPGGNAARPAGELRTYMLKFASAASVAKAINDAFSQSNSTGFTGFNGGGPGGGQGGPGGGGPGGGGPGGGGQGGPGGFGGGQGGPGGGGGGQGANNNNNSQGTVKASSEEYSNTVMVIAPLALQVQVSDFIKKIDIEIKQVMTTKLYPLTFASAQDVATAIQNVLTANATKGRGATTQTQTQGFGPFGGGGNNSQASQGTVSAETRSNSLIVTTSEQNQAIVASLLDRIDKEIVSIDASAVIPLANARATDMATLLNNAFGTRTGTRATAATTSRAASTATTQRSTGTQGALGASVDPKDIYVQMRDPNSDSGELAANVSVLQGFQGMQGFGQQNQNSNSTKTAATAVTRDAQGRVVNTTDLTGKITVVADSNTNSLIVLGDPDAVARLKVIIDQLDKIPEQVVIETMIVEASLDSASKLGVEWSAAQPKAFGNTGTTGTVGSNYGLKPATGSNPGFSYTLTGGNFSAYLNALKTDQKFQVLSTPRIFTSNNVEATINISQSVPYITSQREDTNGNVIFSYSFQDVGIVLTVTPQISPSGMVTLVVSQTANELQGYTSFNAPIVNKREADTTVSVQDGDTIVLGGIMQKTVTATTNKIPILGDLPVLGSLFKSTSKSSNKTELLVFLTPRIVRNPKDAKADTDRQKKELSPESQKKIGN